MSVLAQISSGLLHLLKLKGIHEKKILDSDWLRALHFKCNASVKSVTLVQITHRNSGLRLGERQ